MGFYRTFNHFRLLTQKLRHIFLYKVGCQKYRFIGTGFIPEYT